MSFSFTPLLFQPIASLSDVNHNRKWDGRALEHKQRKNLQKGKKKKKSHQRTASYCLVLFPSQDEREPAFMCFERLLFKESRRFFPLSLASHEGL